MAIQKFLFTSALLFFIFGNAKAQQSPVADQHALRVGDQAPAFQLMDSDGETHSLGELLKAGPVALIFHRSADW